MRFESARNLTQHATASRKSSVDSSSPSSQPRGQFVELIDPTMHAGKLCIPIGKTMETFGRDEWLRGNLKKDLSLCCLFQQGRCFAGAKCHQVHADREFVTQLRAQQAQVVSCCRHCHDTASMSSDALIFWAEHFCSLQVISIELQEGQQNIVPADRIGYTVGLIQAVQSSDVTVHPSEKKMTVPARRVCRLHLRGSCKYGKDCKNVHFCSELGESLLQPNFMMAGANHPRTSPDAVRVQTAPKKLSPVSEVPKITPQERFLPPQASPTIPMPMWTAPQTPLLPRDEHADSMSLIGMLGGSGAVRGLEFQPSKLCFVSEEDGRFACGPSRVPIVPLPLRLAADSPVPFKN